MLEAEPSLAEHLRHLETQLLRSEVRQRADAVAALLAEAFVELF